MKIDSAIWERCVAFHGHVCGGLTIGYKAALYAIDLLKLSPGDSRSHICISADERIVCVAENDMCGVDAIQVILGCSIGKGNLLFHMRGKHAFSFYNRNSEESIRLILKNKPDEMTKEQSFAYYQSCLPQDMFDVKETKILLPEPARFFESYICEACGEAAGSDWIRIQNGSKLCLDCYSAYSRFDV